MPHNKSKSKHQRSIFQSKVTRDVVYKELLLQDYFGWAQLAKTDQSIFQDLLNSLSFFEQQLFYSHRGDDRKQYNLDDYGRACEFEEGC